MRARTLLSTPAVASRWPLASMSTDTMGWSVGREEGGRARGGMSARRGGSGCCCWVPRAPVHVPQHARAGCVPCEGPRARARAPRRHACCAPAAVACCAPALLHHHLHAPHAHAPPCLTQSGLSTIMAARACPSQLGLPPAWQARRSGRQGLQQPAAGPRGACGHRAMHIKCTGRTLLPLWAPTGSHRLPQALTAVQAAEAWTAGGARRPAGRRATTGVRAAARRPLCEARTASPSSATGATTTTTRECCVLMPVAPACTCTCAARARLVHAAARMRPRMAAHRACCPACCPCTRPRDYRGGRSPPRYHDPYYDGRR